MRREPILESRADKVSQPAFRGCPRCSGGGVAGSAEPLSNSSRPNCAGRRPQLERLRSSSGSLHSPGMPLFGSKKKAAAEAEAAAAAAADGEGKKKKLTRKEKEKVCCATVLQAALRDVKKPIPHRPKDMHRSSTVSKYS